MPVLAGRGSNLAKHTYESKINLAEGGPDFASFAKFGDKIANLATLINLPSTKRLNKKELQSEKYVVMGGSV